MIPQPILIHLQENFSIKIDAAQSVSGGCINACFRIETKKGRFFLKWNDAGKYPGMFDAEAKGLAILAEKSAFRIPKVFHQGQAGDYSWLLMEFIENGAPRTTYWEVLGEKLAKMHRQSQKAFGLSYDNYIGSLPQHNTLTENWTNFFVNQRLEPQLRLAIDSSKLHKNISSQFARLYKQLPNLVPDEPSALLHGDLWSGNVIVDDSVNPCLIDPSVYYGHREIELAFTQLFGGFDDEFYKSYNEHYPLASGFRNRVDIYNLYPLLVHVNLFGGDYANQVLRIVKHY